MKNIIIILSVVLLAACTKQDESMRTSQQATGDPEITLLKFYPVYAGGNPSVCFEVTLNIPDSGSVKKIVLYKTPFQMRWYVDNPKTGKYIMYDHVTTDYPVYYSNAFYNFEFEMNAGNKIILDKFQVY